MNWRYHTPLSLTSEQPQAASCLTIASFADQCCCGPVATKANSVLLVAFLLTLYGTMS